MLSMKNVDIKIFKFQTFFKNIYCCKKLVYPILTSKNKLKHFNEVSLNSYTK